MSTSTIRTGTVAGEGNPAVKPDPLAQGASSGDGGSPGALEELRRAYRERDRAARAWKASGGLVAGCLGSDVPEEVLMAAGFLPVRVCGDPDGGIAITDHYVERAFDPLVRSQFGRIVDGTYAYLDCLVISNSSDVLVRIFYFLRELRRVEPGLAIPELYFFDFLHTPYRTSALYNRERLRDFIAVIEGWSGRAVSSEFLARVVAARNDNRRLLRELAKLRGPEPPRVSGTHALQIIGASLYLPCEQHSRLLQTFLAEAKEHPSPKGVRLFVSGSGHDHSDFYEFLESCGAVIVGEDHDWGSRHLMGDVDPAVDAIDAIVDRYHLRPPRSGKATVSGAIADLTQQVQASGAEGVLFFLREGDDPPSWDFPGQRRALEAMGLPVLLLDRQPYPFRADGALRREVCDFIESIGGNVRPSVALGCPAPGDGASLTARPKAALPRKEAGAGKPSVKRLRSAVEANAYQRSWFAQTKERVAHGEPFAFVNADVPMEIFRVMDIPFVVNQWWAAVCSAKQMSPYYLGLLKDRGYRSDLCRYCALSLASGFDPEPEKGPWGGLPRPTIAVSRLTCDAQVKILELWSREFGVPFYPIENTVPLAVPTRWWEKAPHRWEELFETHRIDLMVEELKSLIRFLEMTTGKTFSETRFREVMNLVNQQEEYYRRARDLIARTVPAPVSITDQVPSVMIPQWQRGTQWALDSARSFYEEVRDLVEGGVGACANEKVRLMWIGRGLWFNLGFYQHFEQRYGATFVWSIYLGLAADAYQRYGGDPLRALASRYVGMEDMLHMPPWNSDWYVKEARENQIHGVVHLVSEGCTQAVEGAYFIKKAFEDAGIPFLELHSDPVDSSAWDEAKTTFQLEEFIEHRLRVKCR